MSDAQGGGEVKERVLAITALVLRLVSVPLAVGGAQAGDAAVVLLSFYFLYAAWEVER